ncbi:MAG: S-methyl-5-thioribose-1-phosphate isomerase [Planctomycetota bacterium]|nr:MAG: S-methyl-5-thioribose-1-phosphate isomerase [Planctomycetota bacterium]
MSAPAVSSMRWNGDRLLLVDQRKLPASLEFATCTSARDVAAAIRGMIVRGAPAIGCAAAFGVALEALRRRTQAPVEFRRGLDDACAALTASRPTAVNLVWAVQRMRRALPDGAAPPIAAARLLEEAQAILDEDVRANRAMGAAGAGLLPARAHVLTHCNTGALATGGHGTALGVIRSAVEAGKDVHVTACETRPYLQGARLTAWELQREGIPVTLITDAAAGFVLSRGGVDAVIVGADRVAANGDVANKIGTYPLAVLARRHGVPFYVAAPLSTVDAAVASGADIPIEERGADEVSGFGSERWATAGVPIRNPAFDVTPAELVTGLITERGVLLQPDAARLRALLGPDPDRNTEF